MTVGELKTLLNELSDDTLIVMSSDGEGNSYSPLAGYNASYYYYADSTWSGEIHKIGEENDWGDDGDAWTEEGGVPCLVLWPVN